MRPMEEHKRYDGVVVEGQKRGAALGFPTANIALVDPALSGIYAGRVLALGHAYHAAVYADQKRMLLEAHLLDFSGDLYGEAITIEVFEKIRDSLRFENEAQLQQAIAEDITRIREYFKNHQ
jgi:riboflavin kinase/FMN adenylyltransferase